MNDILSNTGRLLRTVRYLRTGQIANRIARRFARPPVLDGVAPSLREPSTQWIPCKGRRVTMLSPDTFLFLGRKISLDEISGWNDPSLPKLWLYNLHYFDDLLADNAPERAQWHGALFESWIEQNAPMHGNGWEPYVLSRRIVNWVSWQLCTNALSPGALDNLAKQVRALDATLEFHLRGNHLFANAKALVFAGAFFEGEEADRWLKRGLDILETEIPEQILRDGGHFELSPMYHALILEDVLDLLQLARIFPDVIEKPASQQRWNEYASSMLDWLCTMTHPDGDVSFFNDAAFGQARKYADLADYARKLGLSKEGVIPKSLVVLKDSGYVRLSNHSWIALLDVARVGPDYIPGHAHADTLSLELSLDGQRFVTNGGTSTYEIGAVRETERATCAHSTVTIDATNSSEVWASFRVGRRANVFSVNVSEREESLFATASHDGYRHLAGQPLHRRELFLEDSVVKIVDKIKSGSPHELCGRFPLHPSIRSAQAHEGGWKVETTNGRMVDVKLNGPVTASVEQGFYSPEFGMRQSRQVLCWRTAHCASLEVVVEFCA